MILKARLSKLEAKASPDEHRLWPQVMGRSKGECESKRGHVSEGMVAAARVFRGADEISPACR
jgi:hypothetical protein